MPLPPTKPTRPLQEGGKDYSDESAVTPSNSNNLWVGNLASDVTDSDLMDLFAQYGALDSVTSYFARNYAFVFFKRVEDAKAAKNALHNFSLRGHSLKIEFARPVCSHLYISLPLRIHVLSLFLSLLLLLFRLYLFLLLLLHLGFSVFLFLLIFSPLVASCFSKLLDMHQNP